MSVPLNSTSRNAIRTALRDRRSSLDPDTRANAARRICAALIARECYLKARRIGAYLPVGAEASPLPIIKSAISDNKKVFVPVVGRGPERTMRFARLHDFEHLHTNHLGIDEPEAHPDDLIAASDLHLVLVPLVAFDAAGNRIGMGGGYYDRCFEFVRRDSSAQRPKLCGVAYDCQRVSNVPVAEWDIPLDCIVTESGFLNLRDD